MQRKPYNPNTKYGRRKLREQAQQTYENLSPEGKREWNAMGCIIAIIIIVVVGGIIWLLAGPQAALKWLSH
jgi:hypothetical protein